MEKVRKRQAQFLDEERGQKYELYNVIAKTKSNAIKEFAERVKRYSFVDNLSLDGKETVYVDDINSIAKEMTEVQG